MEREIKFRAWHPEENKMWDNVGTDGEFAILDTRHTGLKHLKGESFLMQYTGLKDKNGVEIYESDQVDYYYKDQAIRGVIQWGKVSWCIFYKTPKGFDRLNRISPKAEIEVIGNIHQNPELLTP